MIEVHQKILNKINDKLKTHFVILSRFSGGMSNFTYEVQDQQTQKKFVFRVPGVGAENFVDYQIEAKILDEIKNLGLNSTTVYLDASLGIKIAEFIPGKNLSGQVINLNRIVEKLKLLHESGIQFANNYGHFERLTKYENICKEAKTQQYLNLKAEFTQIYEQDLKQHIHYPCHCDAQLANFIHSDQDGIFLLDWEFAGINDYIYDLASFGNIDFQAALDLLGAYHSNPDKNLLLRLYGWRMFQCLQWHNVAEYKHEIGLGEQLNIPFDKVAAKYLNLASEMFENLKQYQ